MLRVVIEEDPALVALGKCPGVPGFWQGIDHAPKDVEAGHELVEIFPIFEDVNINDLRKWEGRLPYNYMKIFALVDAHCARTWV